MANKQNLVPRENAIERYHQLYKTINTEKMVTKNKHF